MHKYFPFLLILFLILDCFSRSYTFYTNKQNCVGLVVYDILTPNSEQRYIPWAGIRGRTTSARALVFLFKVQMQSCLRVEFCNFFLMDRQDFPLLLVLKFVSPNDLKTLVKVCQLFRQEIKQLLILANLYDVAGNQFLSPHTFNKISRFHATSSFQCFSRFLGFHWDDCIKRSTHPLKLYNICNL